MTLNAKIGGFINFFLRYRDTQVYIIHKEAPPSPTPHAPMCIMVPMGRVQVICDFRNYNYWTGNAIGFRASCELCSNFLFLISVISQIFSVSHYYNYFYFQYLSFHFLNFLVLISLCARSKWSRLNISIFPFGKLRVFINVCILKACMCDCVFCRHKTFWKIGICYAVSMGFCDEWLSLIEPIMSDAIKVLLSFIIC